MFSGLFLGSVDEVILYPFRARDLALLSLSLRVVGEEERLEHSEHDEELKPDNEPQRLRVGVQVAEAISVEMPSSLPEARSLVYCSHITISVLYTAYKVSQNNTLIHYVRMWAHARGFVACAPGDFWRPSL